jgi:oligopeptide transport system substrate-binding protein
MKLVPNPNYWDSSRPRFDEIRVKIMDPEEALIPLFRNQVADVIELEGRELQAVRASDDLRSLTAVFPMAGNWFLVFNVREEPWSDVRVRRAFSMAIDRQDLVPRVFSGSEQPSIGLVPRAIDGGEGEPQDTPEAAADEARQLLAEAGYPGGEGFPPVNLSYHRTSQWERLASSVVARWSDVLGVEVGHDVMEWREYLDFTESPGDFDMYRAGWNSEYLDPENWHNALWFSKEDFLRSGWSNAEYDALVERADVIADQELRRQTYAKAQAILDAELPGIPIAERGIAYLIQPYVTGVWASPLGGYLVFDDAVVERPE